MEKKYECRSFHRWFAVLVLTLMCSLFAGVFVQAEESASKLPGGKDQYNLLLIGSDRRDNSWNGNSDVMILLTIRADAEEIHMTSFMRDLYAEIPGHGTKKLNYAFAVAGAPKLIETLESNYDLTIDNYAIVDFGSMAKIVDMAGGVEITVTDDECSVLNGYLSSMNASEYSIYQGGTYVLNGWQAVAYMRIRYVGNNDYQRTQRQRDVLRAIFAGLSDLTVEDLTTLTNEILPEIEYDINPIQMVQLMAALPELVHYELAESRIPYDDLYHNQGEMLVPDFGATIARLHEELGIQ